MSAVTSASEAVHERFLVVGTPIEHSLSPAILGPLVQEKRQQGFGRREVDREGLPSLIAEMRAGGVDGISVTRPLKEAILPFLDEIAPPAQKAAAVNCVVVRAGRLLGFNTDIGGINASFAAAKTPLRDRQVLILGAGGVARAALVAAEIGGAAHVTVAARRPQQAKALLRSCPRLPGIAVGLRATTLDKLSFDIVIQCTPVGQNEDVDPLPASIHLGPEHCVLDLVYAPLQTSLLRRAQAAGAGVIDGLVPLVEQAALQADLFGLGPLPDAWQKNARALALAAMEAKTAAH